jgi:hypothetical protein
MNVGFLKRESGTCHTRQNHLSESRKAHQVQQLPTAPRPYAFFEISLQASETGWLSKGSRRVTVACSVTFVTITVTVPALSVRISFGLRLRSDYVSSASCLKSVLKNNFLISTSASFRAAISTYRHADVRIGSDTVARRQLDASRKRLRKKYANRTADVGDGFLMGPVLTFPTAM